MIDCTLLNDTAGIRGRNPYLRILPAVSCGSAFSRRLRTCNARFLIGTCVSPYYMSNVRHLECEKRKIALQ
jgi:hypothetical protein